MRLRVLFVFGALATIAALPAQSPAAQPSLASQRHAFDLSAITALRARLGLTFPQHSARPQVPIAPLTASVDLSGHVLDFAGNPVDKAEIEWSLDTGSSSGGRTLTDASGAYDFPAIPVAAGDGWLYMYAPGSVAQPFTYGLYNVSWAAPSTTIDLRPGQLTTQVKRGGPWASRWWGVDVTLFGDAGSAVAGSTPVSYEFFVRKPPVGVNAPTNTMPGSYSSVVCYFYRTTSNPVGNPFMPSEGIDIPLSPAAVVTAGATSATPLLLNEATAMRTWVGSNLTGCASGAPGIRVPVVQRNFPVGWVSDILGYSDSPSGGMLDYGYLTSKTTGANVAHLLVPADATPGYAYWFEEDRPDGSYSLEANYQVCTLKASRASISRGAAIRLSGIIPTANSKGNHPGVCKWVYLYQRSTNTGQPKNWAHPLGWTYVGKYRANIHGIYSTGLLRPTRTTYYVLKYPGDTWYWHGFTSVTRVVVR